VELTELGMAQAAATEPLLRHVSFDRVYCSDLARAKKTAALALPHVTPIYTPAIREIDVVALSFKTPEQCEAEYGEAYTAGRGKSNFVPFGGEDRQMLAERVGAFLRELEQEDLATVGVVCHRGTMLAAAAYMLGEKCPTLTVDNCGIGVFAYRNGCWRMLKWNVTAKL